MSLVNKNERTRFSFVLQSLMIERKLQMSTRNRDFRIDALKGIAFLLVFAVHSVQFIEHIPSVLRFACLYGQTGVQLFLMISGILFARSYQYNGMKAHALWLKRKYFNLLPLYICFAFLYLGVNLLLVWGNIAVPFNSSKSVLAWLANALLLHGFFPFANNTVVPGGWYVGAYFAMLITAPAILWLYGKAKNKSFFLLKTAVALSIVISLISFVLLWKFDIRYDNGSFMYFLFLNQYPAFLIGMQIGVGKAEDTTQTWVRLLAFLGFSVLTCACFAMGKSWCYSLVPMLAAMSFYELYYLTMRGCLKNPISKMKYLSLIGKNSYAAYLISFLFAWYVPVVIKAYFSINGVALWIVSWGIMLLCLPVLSYCLTAAQSSIMKRIKQG